MKTYRVIERPAVEPVSLVEARQHLRLDVYDSPAVHPDDDLVLTCITDARQWAEDFLGYPVAQQTVEIAMDAFPSLDATTLADACCRTASGSQPIKLPGLQSLLSVSYTDEAGATQTLAGYQLDRFSEPPTLHPAANESWPGVATGVVNAVRIRYLAGYTLPGDSPDANQIPGAVLRAIKLVLGHFYENREDSTPIKLETIPLAAQSLLRHYRLHTSIA